MTGTCHHQYFTVMTNPTASAPHPALARLVISVTDLTRALVFYQQVVGLRLTNHEAGLAWLRTTDSVEIMLHERASRPSDAAVAISFLVDHLDLIVSGWQEHGGVVIDPPSLQPWGERMAVIRDQDGHVVCLSERT